ncbi:unnamed protein product [Toxocara canis]|uniref:C2 domain-containing protein n=1 Tax=Toxocara canis TaxID=6265 RepID=A0A3P7GNF4_TOXCA|nr:unnamed protein product [Toxocara canis]
MQDQQRSFVSHWNHGTPGDITFGCEISGVDPMYAFPRKCDFTPAVRIFQQEVKVSKDHKPSKTVAEVNEEGKMIVELRGKCFNASLAIQKHQTHCPWCTSPTELSLISQLPDAESSQDFLISWMDHDHLLSAGVITLAIIAILSSASFTCLLVAYLRRRSSSNFAKKSRGYTACDATNVRSSSLRKSPNDNTTRYDQPWDQHGLSSPYWMNANSLGTMSAAPTLNPSSIIVGRSNNSTVRPLPPRIPAPPSISLPIGRHDDSGHESF